MGAAERVPSLSPSEIRDQKEDQTAEAKKAGKGDTVVDTRQH
jgi:hypothetical protein